ncbi:MAG: serpin family protein [Candidatus Improbicoccus devescovinae]|nr:MAG: serpin family protein [Candidatus Improbicoccus devescovinae]
MNFFQKIKKICTTSIALILSIIPNKTSGMTMIGNKKNGTKYSISESNKKDYINDFNFKILNFMSINRNFMISPYSLKMALMLLANGATGDTRNEILKAFKIEDLETANDEVKKFLEKLGSQSQINMANSVFLNTSYDNTAEFKENYVNNIRKKFNADLIKVDNGTAVNRINNWVSSKTHDKIKNIINTNDFLACLVNAIYFKDDWKYEFKKDNTIKHDFTNKDGKIVQTDFMCQENSFNYYEDSNLKFLEMEYKNSGLSMCIILPKPEKELNQDNINLAFEHKRKHKVKVKLPKFKQETEINNLKEYLNSIGITKAFSSSAELQDMIKSSEKPYIDDIIQKTFIEINEKGTEAAAATAMKIRTTSFKLPTPPYEFTADSPFTYFIKNNNDEILFMGTQAFF